VRKDNDIYDIPIAKDKNLPELSEVDAYFEIIFVLCDFAYMVGSIAVRTGIRREFRELYENPMIQLAFEDGWDDSCKMQGECHRLECHGLKVN
jgi:hypothetical protein